jgi:hypothetical protein
MSELNPEHPVTKKLHTEWHKICLLLLEKLNGGREVVITEADVQTLVEKYPDHAILAHDKRDGLHLKIVTMEQARRLSVQ